MQQEGKIRVKVVSRKLAAGGDAFWVNQCPGSGAVWGSCQFIPDPYATDYEWLVVMHDLPAESKVKGGEREAVYGLGCARENTLLVTTEPPTISYYGARFTAQFGQVLTSQDAGALPHRAAIRGQSGNKWFYGRSYDELVAMEPPEKRLLLSTVCSSKQQRHTLHAKRYNFTQQVKSALPEMDIFGHGVRPLEKKYEALEGYAFHLAIENYSAEHHWTEKLADAFLGWTVPVYSGCTNVFDYFPRESMVLIDINDPEGALETIRKNLSFESYQRRLGAVREARQEVLQRYNLPAMVCEIVNSREAGGRRGGGAGGEERGGGELLTRHGCRRRYPGELLGFVRWKVANFLRAAGLGR